MKKSLVSLFVIACVISVSFVIGCAGEDVPELSAASVGTGGSAGSAGADGGAGEAGNAGSGGTQQMCTPNAEISCTGACGAGTQKCKPDGSGYYACECTTKVCAPGQEVACDCGSGSGHKACKADGSAYGPCVCNGTSQRYYLDSDGDNHGVSTNYVDSTATTPPAGYVTSSDDCNDGDASVYPGATELCDGKDNDCDGQTDEGCGQPDGGTSHRYYHDGDSDNHGVSTNYVDTTATTPPAGYVTSSDDCDDANGSIYPGATEVCANGKDDDCDGQVDEGCSPQDGGNALVSVEAEYDGPDWTVPVIYGSWNGQGYQPLVSCTQSAHHAKCTFEVYEIDLNSVTLQVHLGSGRFWGDVSGNPPALCKTPSDMAGTYQSSVTVIGTLTVKVVGALKQFHMCGNGIAKPSTCATCCSSSGLFPYYNAVIGTCQ